MNRFLLAILAIAMCEGLASCGDDNESVLDPTNPENPTNATKRVVKIVDTHAGNSTTYDISYDNEGRVMSIYADKGNWWSEDFSYSDASASVKCYNKVEGEGFNATLRFNDKGYVTEINSDDQWIITNTYTNDNLTQMSELYKCENENDDVENYVYNYQDGLLVSGSEFSSITYTDIPNIGNICVDEEIFETFEEFTYAGLFGKMYEFLPEKCKIGNDGVYTYSYSLDKDGYVKSVKITDEDGEVSTRDFTYADVK